jgi:serine/threonine protein kinase
VVRDSEQAASADVADERIGQVLGGRYRITELLDEGGMGLIYAAKHCRLGREVAVKVMWRAGLHAQARERFCREASLMSRLSHPHIVGVLDFDFTESGEPYLVMDRLHGQSLEARLLEAGEAGLGVDEAVKLTAEMASALTAVHRAGIVHRDLKPANIFLARVLGHGDVAKLLDFGVGKSVIGDRQQRKLTGEHDLLGTPGYMAPEQAVGDHDRIGPRSDDYALAAMTFEMLAGRPPFVDDDLASLLAAIVHGKLPAMHEVTGRDLPDGIDEVFARALSRDPQDRFPSAQAFAKALDAVFNEPSTIGSHATQPALPIPTEPPSPLSQRRPRRSPSSDRASLVRRRETLPLSQLLEDRHTVDDTKSTPPPVAATPTREVIAQAELAKEAMAHGDVSQATTHAEQSLDLLDADDATHRGLLALVGDQLAEIFEAALAAHGPLKVLRAPETTDDLSPTQAYLLSRLDGVQSLDDVLVIATGTRLETARALVSLVRAGLIGPAEEGNACLGAR